MSNVIKFLGGKNILLLLILISLTVFLNNLIFAQQLNYGFRDQDWTMLYYFKSFGNLSLHHLLESLKVEGIYIYEIYYTGFLEKFIGLNYGQLHFASQFFKMVTAIFLYFSILKMFKKKLLAFFTSLVYTISYTHAGVLFQLATGGYFVATIFMCLFFITYYCAFTSREVIKNSILSSILLIITLILNPERMYPLVAFVIFLEICVVILKKFKRELVPLSIIRISVIILPLFVSYLMYILLTKSILANIPGRSPGEFSHGLSLRMESISQGNWQLLIYPFTSLGSMFFHGEHWKIFGELNFQSFTGFIKSLILGPILKLGVITYLLFLCLFRKAIRPTIIVTLTTFLFGLLIYFLYQHWQDINPLVRIHFDPNFMTMPTLFGFYIFILNLVLLIKWIKNKDNRLIPPILGLLFTNIFIFLTWLPSDIQLTFVGTQRYLSIPAMGFSLFLVGILVIIYEKLRETKFTKRFSWICFLLLFPLIIMNYQIANDFFKMELTSAGLRATDQMRMQNKFREMIEGVNTQEKSLFYFDETADHDNGYFDESTIEAGFEFWTKFTSNGELRDFPEPGMLRTNTQCPEHTHKNCMDILKKGLAEVDGVKGVWYQDLIRGQKEPRFYKLKNLYAFRFINKDFINITEEVLGELNVDSLH